MSLPSVKKKKRVAHCFICGSNQDDENHRFGTFEVNTKRLSEWEKLIPKPGLKIRSAICGRHFDVDDIIKGRDVGGIFQPFKIWKLKDHAVPKHLLCNIFCKCSSGNCIVEKKSSANVCKRKAIRMDTKCYVEGCKSGHEPCRETLYFFKPKDKNTVELWEKFIGRKDLKLETVHLVCHKHFEEANIIKVPVQPQNQTGQANNDRPLPREKPCVKLAAGAVPTLLTGKIVTKVYPSKMVLASLPPTVTIPQVVQKSVQHELPQTLILRPVPREKVLNSKDAVIRPIVINKTMNLLQSNAVQMLQKVPPTAQQITTQQPLTNCQNVFNQQTPPVRPVIQRIGNNTAQKLGKVSSAPRQNLLNPKEATLPISWFWQEGSLKEQEFICSKFKWLDENKFEYTKTVIINGDTRTLRYFLRGQEILSVTPSPFSTVNQLIDRLRIYDQIPECMGYPEPKSRKNSSSSNVQAEENGETRSKNCLLLGSKKSNSCRKCIEDATQFKENVPRQTSNRSKKSSNTQTACQVSSESPITHSNVDENHEESNDCTILTDLSYGAMNPQLARDKRPVDRSTKSPDGEIHQLEGPTVQNKTKKPKVSKREDDENDINDLELAQRFLKKELTRKKTLRRQLHRDLVNHKKHKEMARSILKAAEKLKKITAEKAKRPRVKYARPLMPCEKCGRMVRVARMKLHLKIHDGYKPHVCEVCGRGFANKSSLKVHSRFNHLGVPKPFMCSTCGHMCSNKKTLEIHEMTHTDARPFSCSICDKTYRSKGNLKKHKRSHTGEKPYTCTVCSKSYSHRKSLKKHFSRHHENVGPDGIIDPHIGYTPRKAGTCDKRHSCTICGKAFSEKPSLFKHVKRCHENGNQGPLTRIVVPRYRCEFCQQKFCRVLAFERHRATHTGASVGVPCGQPDCDFMYSSLKELKEHLVARHPEKVFHCELCDKLFLTQLNLTLHQTVHNPAQGFQCTSCPLRTPTMQALLRHEKIHMRERNQE